MSRLTHVLNLFSDPCPDEEYPAGYPAGYMMNHGILYEFVHYPFALTDGVAVAETIMAYPKNWVGAAPVE